MVFKFKMDIPKLSYIEVGNFIYLSGKFLDYSSTLFFFSLKRINE